MSKGQTLDVWLDKMKETNKGYENEINEMNTENINWTKSWVQKSLLFNLRRCVKDVQKTR